MKEIKVLHVSYSSNVGGASVAMFRIHRSLIKLGIESKIVTLINDDANFREGVVLKRGLSKFFHKIYIKFESLIVRNLQHSVFKTTRSLNLFSTGLVSLINNSDCEIVNLHWIGANTVGIKELSKITKPIVWTLHDLWAILGSEHNNISKDFRYVQGYLSSNRGNGYKGLDIEKYVWKLKRKYWKHLNLHLVPVSVWQEKVVKNSLLFQSYPVKCIHNPIDSKLWYPVNKDQSRTKLGISQSKKILLYGAYNFIYDPIKGFQRLVKSLDLIVNKSDFIIAYFGSDEDASFGDFETINFGKISSIEKLRYIYSSADVFLMPSLQETFGQTVLEGIYCNLPVVAYSGTGVNDILIHKVNGFLAEEDNINDFYTGIQWVLDHSLLNIRESVGNKFSSEVIGEKYLKLYKEILCNP
ncbi:Glycosyltransferase involved in cell wall bisynthesis [Sphingobacterium nematocida]|uniref:Glycosyltransferase involved in cell wall bisynthesis n=1 Tax=Sphingobacterium nematocida TaxID=1513896 RepID=A0A1T5EXX0_9SPHI|nr:glycosyltransferase [Sphingobacterium nematocida]SKB88793.1 Glycosyltransferase involved in cell wall bisynthesis [Sphingobacterium nematocida]